MEENDQKSIADVMLSVDEKSFASAMDTILNGLSVTCNKSGFLVNNQDFLSNHLDFLFRHYEGASYSHDKTRTILRSLDRFFKDGIEIKFNYDQEYTYHLPKRILKNHEDIMLTYHALEDLFHGDPTKYLNLV